VPQAGGQALLWGGKDFQHPAATHQILLRDGTRVAYRLERAMRRSIGFQVGEGLAIRAPRWISLEQLDAAIHEKARWIVQKLQEQRERTDQAQAQRIAWADGAVLPFLGGQITLHLHQLHRAAEVCWRSVKAPGRCICRWPRTPVPPRCALQWLPGGCAMRAACSPNACATMPRNWGAVAQPAPVQRAHALGQRQERRQHHAELALAALSHGGAGLCGGA
jgi:hypothetical protein